jgi:predicted NUDIX family NTP pyrophosphohydrolase
MISRDIREGLPSEPAIHSGESVSLKKSAGVLMYRRSGDSIEVFLIHPGGPFWAKKDFGAWSIPKGQYEDDEAPLDAARREFREETGFDADGEFIPLAPIKQKSGKVVSAWAVEGSIDATAIESNTFSMEWPPKSGRQTEFPEADGAGWFSPDEARVKLNPAQAVLVDSLCAHLGIAVTRAKP